MDLNANQTFGLVCAHHHLYSSLARGMPSPDKIPNSFGDILNLVWWKLDRALDLETIEWSAKLGALEALESGTTCIIDHHESPHAIEGSLTVIQDACHELGVRVNTCYGVTDRNCNDFSTDMAMTEEARRGLEENRRFLQEGGLGMVGIHAAFTCTDETLNAAAQLASDMGVGVHVHVAEGDLDAISWRRLQQHATDDWILVHGVLLPDNHQLRGIIIHNPRSNMNNSVGYADPTRFENRVGLGTDGIGADMLEEFRIGYARLREFNVEESPETVWKMLDVNTDLFPECRQDKVTWSYKEMDPWHLAFTSGVQPVQIEIDGKPIMRNGEFLDIDSAEIRAKAGEAAEKLFKKIKELV